MLLEKMTNIMTQHPNVSTYSKRAPVTNVQMQMRSSSLNRRVRQKELVRITNENECLLKRLQEKTSHYNVFEWRVERKKQVKMIKKICYYPPSLLKKSRLKSRRIDTGGDPNYELY